jgi:hypothetical protein
LVITEHSNLVATTEMETAYSIRMSRFVYPILFSNVCQLLDHSVELLGMALTVSCCMSGDYDPWHADL